VWGREVLDFGHDDLRRLDKRFAAIGVKANAALITAAILLPSSALGQHHECILSVQTIR
jgi:hypothetical protein